MTLRLVRRLILMGIGGVGLCLLPTPSRSQVDIHVGIQLPPPLVFSAPPEMVVLPGTYVYVVPDIAEDVFFFDGWWWRPWQGRWYRSRYYERGWSHYSHVPSFYRQVPHNWRHEYQERQWSGRPWNYERVPHDHVEKNWNNWKKEGYWEKHQTWGVQGWQPQRHGHDQRPQAPRPEQHGQRPHAHSAPHGQSHGQDQHTQQHPSQKPSKSHGGHDQENHGHGHGKSSQQHGGKEAK